MWTFLKLEKPSAIKCIELLKLVERKPNFAIEYIGYYSAMCFIKR